MTSPLRVGVNLLWCLPGAVGGSEQYLVRQLSGLLTDVLARPPTGAGDLDLTVFATAEFGAAHATELAGSHLVHARSDGHRRWRRVLDESTWLHGRTAGLDLVHHGGGTAPVRTRHPYVLTVHDVQYRTFPQHFSRVKRAYLDAVMPRSARHAAIVTVPSEYVRATVIEHFDAAAERVIVVPHGYEPALLVERTPAAELRSRYGLGDGPVIVYPAMSAPHKNHRFLVELMARHWIDPALRLVLIGGSGSADHALAAAIAAAGAHVSSRIVRPGRVTDADRNGLLALATAMVFPSTYEGFGAPLIEAMALGTPVVCSDATCLPEVAGDAAIVLPLVLDAWAGALDEVSRRRDQLVVAGHRRAEGFTAEESGRALRAAYEQAVR